MSTWNIQQRLSHALYVAGNAHLGEDSRSTLRAVLESLDKGPPPVVELRKWIVEFSRMASFPLEALQQQLPDREMLTLGAFADEEARLDRATNALFVAADDAVALDARTPWGLLVLAATMASATDGVVYDSGTFRLVPRWILENPLDGYMLGSIKNHVAIMSSVDDDGVQSTTTVGLNKYGLFELKLELPDATASPGNLGMLLAGVAQALVDARPPTPGAWDVPPFLDITAFHVRHAFAYETDPKVTGTARLELRPKDEAYWSVVAPERELDGTYLRNAMIALDIKVERS